MIRSESAYDLSEERSSFDGEGHLLKIFLREVKRFPLLSAVEERSLVIESAAGDRLAEARLINSNLRFVIRTALSFWHSGSGVSLLDLVQAGSIGLVRAVRKSEPAFECRLLSYAGFAVKKEIVRVLIDHQKYKCESLDNPVYEGYEGEPSGETRLDRLPSEEDEYSLAALHRDLCKILESLSTKQQTVIVRRYWNDDSTREIGRLLHISAKRVRQVELRALYQLRWFAAENEASYVS